jgi:hypothetical protein
MTGTALAERDILVVEDEVLIARDVCQALRDAGARVALARGVADATRRQGHCRPPSWTSGSG